MPSRSYVRVGSAAILVLALAVPAGGALAQDGTTITMLTPAWGVPPDADLLAAFEDETGITVEVIGGEGVAMDKLFTDVVTASATGQSAADVIFLTEEAPSNVVAIGGVEDLSDLVEAAGTDLSVFDGVDFWRDDMGLYGIPVYSQLVMIDYNAAKLAEAGFDEVPATWAEFTDVARSIQEQGIDDNPLSFKADDWTWYLMALSMGDPMFDEDLNPVFANEGS
jgi:ABC-type glycerol-3-phosphate transport system substrate-binding protein